MSRTIRELSWIHLSDVHCGQGDAYEANIRKDVLNEAIKDASRLAADAKLTLDFALISGDLFQSGATRTQERAELDEFVATAASELSIQDGVYCVPGNHDLDRTVEGTDAAVQELLDNLRDESGTSVDRALSSAEHEARLLSRFRIYTEWVAARGYNRNTTPIAPLAWERLWQFDRLSIRLRGINSSWLAMNGQDNGRLQIHLDSISRPIRIHPDEVSLLVLHHPIDWCRNHQIVKARVSRDFNVLISGHEHSASISSRHSPRGRELVEVSAGAVHDPTKDGAVWERFDTYNYSVCSISLDANDQAMLHQWPRRWSQKAQEFVADVELTDKGSNSSSWRLARAQERGQRSFSPLRVEPNTAERIIGSLPVDTAIERFGTRRTAFPTDASIAELARQNLIVAPAFQSSDGGELSVERLVADILRGKNVLILGAPGSGKSVALYGLAQQVSKAGARAIPLRFSDLRQLFDSGVDIQRGLRTGDRDRPVVLVDGLDEASVSDGLGAKVVGQWLEEIEKHFTLVLSCRQAEFETHLATYVSNITFPHLAHIKFWRPEVEFKDFVSRLIDANHLPDRSLLAIVESDANIRSLVTRPLFARMLCLVGNKAARSIESAEDLYVSFFGGLAQRTELSLSEAGCYLGRSVESIWAEAAWQSFRVGLLQDEALQYDALVSVLAHQKQDRDCISRALSSVVDAGSAYWRRSAAYVHYSFYEFLLSSALENRILSESPLAEDKEVIDVLYKDIPRRVRHFLVNRLRRRKLDRGGQQLLGAYRRLRSDPRPEGVRTGCNLMVYILSRVYACSNDLRELLSTEEDLFIRNSLFWGLAHNGDMTSTEQFVRSLEESVDHSSMCRGYLLYYHGDLGFVSIPPFFDRPQFVSWARTRSAVIQLMSASTYEKDVPVTRRIIDAYTFMSFALVRGEKLREAEAQMLATVTAGIKRSDVPPWIADVLDRDYFASC